MSSMLLYRSPQHVSYGDGAAGVLLLEPTFEDLGDKGHYTKSDGAGGKHLHMKAGGSLKPSSVEQLLQRSILFTRRARQYLNSR